MTDWADADLTVAVVGAGAIGCRIAAHLDNEGIACTLFDGWHEHVEAIRREGLHFEHGELSSQHNLQAHHYEDATLAPGPYDVVLLCTPPGFRGPPARPPSAPDASSLWRAQPRRESSRRPTARRTERWSGW